MLGVLFQTVLGAIRSAPAIVAAAPQFVEIVQGVMPLFTGAEQDELKTALAEARKRSDDAQDDFVEAGRGK